MKYRTRLYLYIGSLFVIVMVASYLIESLYTHRELIIGRDNAQKQIEKSQERRRQHTENYLKSVLEEVRAKIKTQVYELEAYIPLQQSFTDQGAQWVSSATYVVTTMWIDMLQIGPNEKMDSLLILKDGSLNDAEIIFDEPGMAIAHMGGIASIAVPLKSAELISKSESLSANSPASGIDFYVLYDPLELSNYNFDTNPFYVFSLTVDPLQPFFSWKPYKLEIQGHSDFLQELENAQAILKANPSLASLESIQAPVFPTPAKNLEEKMLSTYEQQGMVWALSTFTVNASSLLPKGIVRVQEGSSLGLMSDEVFFRKPQLEFNDKKFDIFSVIPAPKLNRFFFGETVRLSNRKEVTMGASGDNILKELARATNETTLFYANGKIVSAYDYNGERLYNSDWDQVPRDLLSEKDTGFVEIGNEEYFYLHLQPIKELDMHFFLFQPKAEAFALILELDANSKHVIHDIGWQMRIIFAVSLVVVLVLLHFLAKRVTGRITLLADATNQMADGHYDEVNLPEEQPNENDEIAKLYSSFKKMLQGMIEKEKVRGVLDKVVSSEIAEEILKGEVALGGEERVVAVLFADIRGFTSLTEKMKPSDAICLLNECMTLIAKVIDSHEGVIDKFVGDEVMALFGAPIDKEFTSLGAVKCGIEMVRELTLWNEKRKAAGLTTLDIGVGIHKGPMIAGNMGSENRLNYTVIGANVNLASRLCSVAGPMELVISQAVYEGHNVKEAIQVSSEKEVELKGFSEPVKVYSISIQ
jgi:class 3 adenylate cyclase/HAMP domain-containing protein